MQETSAFYVNTDVILLHFVIYCHFFSSSFSFCFLYYITKVIIHKSCGEQYLWNRKIEIWADFGPVGNKVEKILKGSLDSIPSPSASVKIQIVGGKVCLRCKGKTLLGVVNKLLKTKSLLISPSNVLPYYLKKPFSQ